MQGFEIIKVEADASTSSYNVVAEFNSYMQREASVPSFICENEGYFRISYDEKVGASSAPIVHFGKFLSETGYTISALSAVTSSEGQPATLVQFEKDGKALSALLSTINIY